MGVSNFRVWVFGYFGIFTHPILKGRDGARSKNSRRLSKYFCPGLTALLVRLTFELSCCQCVYVMLWPTLAIFLKDCLTFQRSLAGPLKPFLLILGALGRSWEALGTLLGGSRDAFGALLDALGRSWALLGCFWHAHGSIEGFPKIDLGISEESPWLLQEGSEQSKRMNADIPKVDRKLSENRPSRSRKPNLYSRLPPR